MKQLHPILSDLIHDIFDNIEDDMIIKSWLNQENQKADIFIKINNQIRSISIKMGAMNSVHTENVYSLCNFFRICGIPKNIINSFLKYQFADGTNDNTGKIRMSAEEYKESNQKDLDEINNYFNNKKILRKVVDRFILKGLNSAYKINALVYGTPNDFFYLLPQDIYKILENNINDYCSAPHFSSLVCQSMNRCLKRNPKSERFRYYVQIKWYSLFEDIMRYENDKVSCKSE